MDLDAVSAALARAAAQLELHGDALGSRITLIARQRDAMRWQSPAARACRARIETVLHLLLATSARLRQVADDVRSCSARLANGP